MRLQASWECRCSQTRKPSSPMLCLTWRTVVAHRHRGRIVLRSASHSESNEMNPINAP